MRQWVLLLSPFKPPKKRLNASIVPSCGFCGAPDFSMFQLRVQACERKCLALVDQRLDCHPGVSWWNWRWKPWRSWTDLRIRPKEAPAAQAADLGRCCTRWTTVAGTTPKANGLWRIPPDRLRTWERLDLRSLPLGEIPCGGFCQDLSYYPQLWHGSCRFEVDDRRARWFRASRRWECLTVYRAARNPF